MLIYDEKDICSRPNTVVRFLAMFRWSAAVGHNCADLVKSYHFADTPMALYICMLTYNYLHQSTDYCMGILHTRSQSPKKLTLFPKNASKGLHVFFSFVFFTF